MIDKNRLIGSGWSFPPVFDNASDYTLQMVQGGANIAQAIDMILQTPRGSRPLTPEFGSTLKSLMFRKLDERLQADVIRAVQLALKINEPRISVESVTTSLHPERAMVMVCIQYLIRQTQTRQQHHYPFGVMDGHDLSTGS